MNPYMPFDTALVLLVVAYTNSVLLLIATSNVGLAVIEAIEDIND